VYWSLDFGGGVVQGAADEEENDDLGVLPRIKQTKREPAPVELASQPAE